MRWVPIVLLLGALISIVPSASASTCSETHFLIVEQRSCDWTGGGNTDCIWTSPAPGLYVCDSYYEWNDGSMGSTCHSFDVAGIIWADEVLICPGG